jgi:hypothetical protein
MEVVAVIDSFHLNYYVSRSPLPEGFTIPDVSSVGSVFLCSCVCVSCVTPHSGISDSGQNRTQDLLNIKSWLFSH